MYTEVAARDVRPGQVVSYHCPARRRKVWLVVLGVSWDGGRLWLHLANDMWVPYPVESAVEVRGDNRDREFLAALVPCASVA